MKFTSFSLLTALFFLTLNALSAQNFLEPSFTFSSKKISYLTMDDGSTMEVYVQKISRKKGLIEELKIEDKDGKKLKIKPEQIKTMYLPQSGYDKMTKALDVMYDAQKWDNKEVDGEKIAEGYIYFEKAEVMVKKQKQVLMMQLLNPSFSGKIKVYHDPYAQETASMGIGGISVAGGDAKSYYISVAGKAAFKLFKKNYDEEILNMYGGCEVLKKQFEKMKWSHFEEHIYVHSQECN